MNLLPIKLFTVLLVFSLIVIGINNQLKLHRDAELFLRQQTELKRQAYVADRKAREAYTQELMSFEKVGHAFDNWRPLDAFASPTPQK